MKKENITFTISIIAIVISILTFLSNHTIKEEVKLFAYDVEYDVEEKLIARFTLALINNGDMGILIPDVWITVGSECSVENDNRIYPAEKAQLLSSKSSISVADYQFNGEVLGEKNHEICLFVKIVSGLSGTTDRLIRSHDLKVLIQSGEKFITFTNTDEWENVYPLSSGDFFKLW